jgi:hypothetical protein
MMIGVAKAGTTSFFHYLNEHPQIYMAPEKVTNYFGYEDARDWKWHEEGEPPLLRNFPVKTWEEYQETFAGVKGEPAIGEVSPQYFRCPTAAGRIHDCMPGVKLIVSLRNPAERAFSGFMMRTRRGEPVKGLYQELTVESSHVKEGFYYRRMKRYMDLFPREQIKIYIFEQFKKTAAATIRDLYDFVGVDPSFSPDLSVRHNPGAVPKIRLINRLFFSPSFINFSKAIFPESLHGSLKKVQQMNLSATPKMPADLRAELLQIYRQDILDLQSLIDRDLSIWLN